MVVVAGLWRRVRANKLAQQVAKNGGHCFVVRLNRQALLAGKIEGQNMTTTRPMATAPNLLAIWSDLIDLAANKQVFFGLSNKSMLSICCELPRRPHFWLASPFVARRLPPAARRPPLDLHREPECWPSSDRLLNLRRKTFAPPDEVGYLREVEVRRAPFRGLINIIIAPGVHCLPGRERIF